MLENLVKYGGWRHILYPDHKKYKKREKVQPGFGDGETPSVELNQEFDHG